MLLADLSHLLILSKFQKRVIKTHQNLLQFDTLKQFNCQSLNKQWLSVALISILFELLKLYCHISVIFKSVYFYIEILAKITI